MSPVCVLSHFPVPPAAFDDVSRMVASLPWKEGYSETLENNELILLSILSWSVNNRLTLWTLELHTLVIFGLVRNCIGSTLDWIYPGLDLSWIGSMLHWIYERFILLTLDLYTLDLYISMLNRRSGLKSDDGLSANVAHVCISQSSSSWVKCKCLHYFSVLFLWVYTTYAT